jgi:hypothetical protein
MLTLWLNLLLNGSIQHDVFQLKQTLRGNNLAQRFALNLEHPV